MNRHDSDIETMATRVIEEIHFQASVLALDAAVASACDGQEPVHDELWHNLMECARSRREGA